MLKLIITIALYVIAFAFATGSLFAQGSIAHIADGAGWKTIFILTNLTGSPVKPQVSFWGDDGKPLALPMSNGIGTLSSFVLPAGLPPYVWHGGGRNRWHQRCGESRFCHTDGT